MVLDGFGLVPLPVDWLLINSFVWFVEACRDHSRRLFTPRWFVNRGNLSEKEGPFSLVEIQRRVLLKEVEPKMCIRWEEGDNRWILATDENLAAWSDSRRPGSWVGAQKIEWSHSNWLSFLEGPELAKLS